MAVPISNVTRRQVYAPSGAGGAGPYAFTFEILANTDIAVYKDDVLLTLTTHYTVVINANGTGSVTITAAGLALAPASPTQYAIVGNRTISRTTDFTTGGDFFANVLNDELDQQTIFAQQNAEGLQRALQAPQTDPTSINMTLPRASDRANKTLNFDANGNPIAGLTVTANAAANVATWLGTPSSANLRAAMTDETGTGALVFADAPTFSGNPTLSAGTANGVAYLNGSKVLTTGSALTFDGTNLKTTGSVLAGGVVPSSGAGVTLAYNGSTTGYIYSYDWGASAYKTLNIAGGTIDLSAANNTQITFGVNGSEQMRLTSTGLKVGTTSDFSGAKVVTDGGGIGILNKGLLRSSTNGVLQVSADPNNAYASSQISFDVDGSTVATLDSSGRLGIGVTPNTLIDAGGASSPIIRAISSLTNNAAARMLSDGDTVYFGSQNSSTSGGNVPVVFKISGTERARIDSSGNLLVGTTTSSGDRIYVSGYVRATSGFKLDGSTYIDAPASETMRFVTFGTERARITSGGEVYIAGTTDQGAYNLQVNGTGVWGAGAYVNGSDRNLKDNIQSLDSCLDVVMAMRPVTFQYKLEHSKDQSIQPGFIAQELQEAMTGKAYIDGVVQAGPEYLNVAYQNIIPILVKAIQELKAEIATLKGA